MDNSSGKESAQGRYARVNPYLLGVAMIATLVAGVAIGVLINRPRQSVQVVVTATPKPGSQPVAQANEQPSTQNNLAAASTSTGNEANTAGPPTPTIMDFVLSDARHFQGSVDAPVTLIEFSDFK